MSLRVLRRDDHRAMPWKNGGGVTHEVARSPVTAAPDVFDWRISFADVESCGPFSSFPEIDRMIILVEGDDVKLTIDGDAAHLLRRFEPFAFPGEAQVWCDAGQGNVDLNVMTRRGRVDATVECLGLTGAPQSFVSAPGSSTTFVAVLDGYPTAIGPRGELVMLTPRDVVTDVTRPITLVGLGMLAAISIIEV
jgi:environmental stress-induced protein Ves